MKLRKLILAVFAVVVVAGIVAPFLNAGRFRGRIQSALEAGLKRHVVIGPKGEVRFNVFTGPGFTISDVLIEEAPGFGIEPFAHVQSIQARIRLASLWTGHMGFSSIKLVEPSVNFVKSEAGPWNVQPFLSQASSSNPGPRVPVPEIQIRDGRFNFKFGDTKSVFYIDGADLDVYPGDDGNLVLRFTGEPARTDHAAQGLGRLVARGVLTPERNGEDKLNASVQLERTPITELARLFDLQDSGVRGYAASNLRLEGPLSRVNISGDLRIEDIHRWDLMPNKGEGWTLAYAGLLNLPGQQLEIETRAGDAQGTPVNGRFVASNYLTSPKWKASLSFHDLPAAGLVDTARHMGAPLPAGATLDGKLNGQIVYARPEGINGDFVLTGAALKFPQGAPTQFDSAPVHISSTEVRIGPAEIREGEEETVRLNARYALDSRDWTVGLETDLASIAQSKSVISRLLGAGSVPFFERCRQGAWRGAIRYDQMDDSAGVWAGEFELQNAVLDVNGLASPLRVASAAVQVQKDSVSVTRLRGHAGTISIEGGDYRALTSTDRPDRLHLVLGEVRLGELERLFTPTLSRQQGFLARALRLGAGAPLPEWLKTRSVEGTFQCKQLLAGDLALGAVRGRLAWNGANVQLIALETKLGDMRGTGRVTVNLAGASPKYHLTGQMHAIEYRNGLLDLEGVVDTVGLGQATVLNARSDGTFSGTDLDLSADSQVNDIAGEYHLDLGGSPPQLTLTKVQATQGSDTLHGQGFSQSDGHLILEMTTGRKRVRLTGMLLPLSGELK